MSSSRFAQRELSKHGWKEGAGLGKDESGIKEPIKVKIKHDSHGVGHSRGDEFSFHWWDHVFNKAASNINVNATQDGIQLSQTKDSGQISTTKAKTYDNKAILYGKFVKGATLANGNYEATNENESDDDEDDEESAKPPRIQDLDDAELLKACGGLTGHKAARHGHKLNGKLARIQEQEALLMAKYRKSAGNVKTEICDETKVTEETKRKDRSKKKRKKRDKEKNEKKLPHDISEDVIVKNMNKSLQKRKDYRVPEVEMSEESVNDGSRKRKDKRDKDGSDADGLMPSPDTSDRKKRKKRDRGTDICNSDSIDNFNDNGTDSSKRDKGIDICNSDSENNLNGTDSSKEAKKEKKRKRKAREQCEVTEENKCKMDENGSVCETNGTKKKKKRKKQKRPG